MKIAVIIIKMLLRVSSDGCNNNNNNDNNNPLFSHDSVLKLNSLCGRAQMKSNQIKSIHIKSNVSF